MKIINLLNYKETIYNTALALGNFDGVHLGHQELIKVMVRKSKELGLKSSLLIFKTHPKNKVSNKKTKLITSNQQKFEIFKNLGVDIIYLLEFNDEIMKLTGGEFVKDIIINKTNGKLLVVGFDYKFGYKASGDSKYLLELGKEEGIDVVVLDPIYIDNILISSSSIRESIINGNINDVSKMLGRLYSIMGKVIPGKNRGNKLGFPTANLELIDDYVIPKNGVYFTKTILNNKEYISATNIGYNPTFNEQLLKIENHILDFNQNIYGESLEIKFIDFLREDIKFSNKEDLISQMKEDIDLIKARSWYLHLYLNMIYYN